jgi:hypothetical protein
VTVFMISGASSSSYDSSGKCITGCTG